MKKITRSLLCLTIIILAVCGIDAQNAVKNWVFGNRVKVDFNSGSPVASTLPAGTINTFEGSSSISDSSGTLLFYTDGVTVWDKNNSPMPNGTGLMGDSSATHSALIVPCSCSKYFIFTPGVYPAFAKGLRYSIVDMSVGTGSVMTGAKNVPLLNKASEKIAAVSDGNHGFWVVAHSVTDSSFFSYHIRAGSECTVDNPVVSTVGTSYALSSEYSVGQMKISPDGKRLAAAGYQFSGTSFVELFKFDTVTGIVSDLANPTVRDNSADSFYGIEFSPDSKSLYATTVVTNNYLYRYNITAANPLSSRTAIGPSFGNGQFLAGALQLAPDGNIYMARHTKTFLSVLNSPSSAAPFLSTFNLASGGSNSQLGLPTMVAGDFSCDASPACYCDTMKVTPAPNPPLTQDYRTFEIFNQLSSPICSIDINMTPLPPTTFWQGGEAYQNLTSGYPSTPVNFVYASAPPAYRRVPTTGVMAAVSNPLNSPAVKFNLGFDNTQAYSGATSLTVNHCDGRKCALTYTPWIVTP